jgi:uncharacterized phage infection (PIP) family protein YhgE
MMKEAAAVALTAMNYQTQPTLLRQTQLTMIEEARSRLEQRFLDGGAVLLSVLDILNKMIGSLDTLTSSLDEETAAATMDELAATISALSGLTARQADRQARLKEIALSERILRPHVAAMQETLRYLRTFAVTAKITGAGIADFAGFAEEILQRIQEGAQQVNNFSDRLAALGRGLGPVMAKGEATLARYGQQVPKIVDSLNGGITRIRSQRQDLAARASQVRSIARGIQGKLASTLSAMQIGDITRQRLEHCQSSFVILEEYLNSADADHLDGEKRQNLKALIRHLVANQLAQSRQDFDRDTTLIVQTVSSFTSELAQISAIQRAMTGEDDDQTAGAMRSLEAGVAEARQAVGEIETVARAAGEMTERTLSTVQALLEGIGVVQIVRGDIHYMALNTNLRCGKIGEEGRAINVVTAELRIYAGQLDDVADKILDELKGLQGTTEQLLADADGTAERPGDTLDARLARAVDRIHSVAVAMEADLERMAQEGQGGIQQMNAALLKLDFQADLGEILRRCAEEFAIDGDDLSPDGLEEAIAVVGPQINRLYTMASERELHARILGTAAPAQAPTMVLSDDDLDDALF